MRHLWRIGTDTPDYEAHDSTGTGAKLTGGRWNRAGNAMIYTSSTIALACLETTVHLGAGGLPLNRYLVRIDVPSDLWRRRIRLDAATAPIGWDAIPEGRASLDYGDLWLVSLRSVLLEVPSVIVPDESNVLVNPAHSDAKRLVFKKLKPWRYDSRLR